MSFFNGSKKKLWYTIQPKEGDTTWELLTPTPSMDFLNRSTSTKEGKIRAKDIHDILCKRIAFLSGGKDKRGRPILTIPNVQDPLQHTEYAITTTLKYLSYVAKKTRNLVVILDIRYSTWNAAKPMIGILQYCLRDHIAALYIVKPREFWEKQVANFNFKVNKERLGFKSMLVSPDKLHWYIDQTQLTKEFKGKLYYDHQHWIRNRVHYEKYIGEAEEKLDVFQNFSQKAKQWEEASEGDSSSIKSDSGNVTGPTSPATSSDTLDQHRGFYHVGDTDEAPKRSTAGSREHVYQVSDANRYEQPLRSCDQAGPVPAPRKSLTSVTSPMHRNETRVQSRHRSRSVPPERTEREGKTNNGARSPLYSHVYSLPDYEKVARKRTKSGKLPRSSSEYNVSQESESTTRGHNGPRPLRNRRASRSRNEEIGDERKPKIVSSKSVPNLTKYDDGNYALKRKNSTLVDGEKLLKDLQSLSDENGFNIGRTQPLSDENFSMIQNISNYQEVLSRLEEKNMEKIEKKKERNLSRRKTVTGLPALDGAKGVSQFSHLPSPIEIQEKLKLVYDWFRGPAEAYLNERTSYVESLREVESLTKVHTEILSKCMEKVRSLRDIKSSFENLASSKLSASQKSNSLEPIPQWILSISRSLEIVEKQSQHFQSRLQERSDSLQWSFAFYKSAKKLSASLSSVAQVCKSEATLLDCLDAIQNQMGQLHHHTKTMKELHEVVIKAAGQHVNHIQKLNKENKQTDQRGLFQVSHVHHILSQLQLGVDRCSNLAQGTKVRLDHVYQLKAAQKDVQQAIEWLCDSKTTIQNDNRAFGKSAKEVENLMEQQENIKITGKFYYDNGNKQLSALAVLRRCLELSPHHGAVTPLKRSNSSGQLVSKSGLLLPSLEDAWEEFIESCEERRSKLTVAHLFYKNAEQLLKRGSQLEVDLDNAYVYTTGSQISPLREAHYSFHDNWDKVMKLGDNLLQPSSTSQTQSQDYLHLPIHDHMKQLENLRSSLQAKWAKVKGKNVNSSENLRSPGSSQSWIENVSESTDWVRSKLVQCSPNMFEIGRNLKEATKLQNEHKNLLQDIKEKDSEIFALLEKEQQSEIFTSSSALPSSSSQSTAESQQERKVQKAMSYSLADMWKDLTSLLARRNTVLHATVQFYTATEKFGNHLTCLEQYLHWNELPLDASTARSLLKVLEEMYNQMMDASRTCLTDGGELVNMLKQLKPDNSDRHRASFGSATTSVECNLESLIERQRLLEFDYQSRKKKLEHILKIRQWEEEVDKVATWFELIRLKQLDGNELGFDDSNTHALICHLDQVKEQVQERLEKAKKLINRANAELKAFGNDPVKMQSRDLDRLGESLMEQIQKRKKELAAVQAYYHQVKECEVSLGVLGKKLDSGRFSSDQEEAEEQRKNFLDCINAATLPVLDKADLILKMRENKLEGAEGVVDARDEVIMKQEALFEMIRRLASDASRLHETLVLFKANCDDLKKWLTDMEAEAFSSSTSMPDNMGKSTQFLEWHRLLQHDVERKTSSIRSLIESANLLLETGISNPEIVKEQAEDVKVAWFDLNKKIKQRVSTSEDFVNFLTNLEKLSEDIDKSHALVLHHSKSSTNQLSASYLNELEESVNQIDNECLNIMEDSNRVNTKLRELNTDNFDVSAAVNFVTEKVVRLHKKKSEFKDVWLTWRYKSGINQETSAQIKVVEKNIKTIMDSFEKLEKSVFPNGVISFGKNGESNCILIDELHCRQSTLDDLRSEIEKAVKHAEMLGMRLSSSNELNRDDDVNEDEQLRNIVKEMLISHQNLQLKLKNYKNLLQILQDFYALCSNLQVIMEEFESGFLDPSLSSPQVNDDFYLDVKLGSHDQIKEQVDDKLKDIEVKSDDIEDALQNHYFGLDCPDLVEVKKTIVDMQTMHSDWVTSWTNQRKKLLDQRGLLGFYQDYDKHRNALAVAEERLQSLKKQLPVCRSSLEAEEIEDELSELFSDFEKIEQAWNKFASSRQLEATRSSIEMDAIERTSREVVNKLRGTEKAIRSANTLGKIFKLSNEYDKWNEEIQQIATAIRDKSASIRSLEEAQEIIEMFDDNLLPNIDEQASRSKAVASVIVQADDSAFDSGDEGNDANLSSQTSEREFHELLKSKQFHVKQSLSILRAEADELSTSIDGAREQLKAAPIAHVKPYDMTVLLDENLEKERLYSEMKRKIFDSTSPRTLNEDKPTKYSQISLHVSSSSAFSTSGSSCSNEYTLPEQGPKLGKNTPIKDKFVKNQEMEENNYPKFINNFFQRDSSSASISDNSYSSSTPFGKTVDNNPRSTPPKPPRNKKGRRQFWEQELDDFQPYSRQHRTDLFGSSSNDDPLDDNEKEVGASLFEESSPEILRCKNPEKRESLICRAKARAPSIDSFTSVSSCDTDFLLKANFAEDTWSIKDDFRQLPEREPTNPTKTFKVTNTVEKKPCWRRVRRVSSSSSGLQSGVVLKTTKTKDTCRIVKPKNSFKTTSMFPQSLLEESVPKCCHSRSESFLSTSSSVWDTDCLIAADPKTTRVPSVLVRSARNELDTESDVTEELLKWDPYKGLDLSSTDDNFSDDTLFIPKTEKKHSPTINYKEATSLSPRKDFWKRSNQTEVCKVMPHVSSQDGAHSPEKQNKFRNSFQLRLMNDEGTFYYTTDTDTSNDTVVVVPDTKYVKITHPLQFNNNFNSSTNTFGSSVVTCSDVTMTSPAFVETLQGVVCEEGGTALFKAHVTGTPTPQIHWLRGDNDVTSSHNYQVVRAADGQTSLRIAEVFDEDAGEFTCKATNDHGEAFSSAELVVETTSMPPDFTQKLANIEASPGEQIQFKVETAGIPKPDVKWYREGAEIRDNDDFQLRCEGNAYTLTITGVCEEDAGQFTVTASNSTGKATSTSRLVVSDIAGTNGDSTPFETRPNNSSTNIRSSSHRISSMTANQSAKLPSALRRGKHYAKPGYLEEVIQGLDEKRKIWGELAEQLWREPHRTDSCSTEKWARGLSPIISLNASKRKIAHCKNSNHVVFDTCSISHHHATHNSHQSKTSSASLTLPVKKPISIKSTSFATSVQKDFAVFPPFIKSEGSEIKVREGEIGLISCEVVGNPVPNVSWSREGARIENSHDFEQSFTGKVATLLIRDIFADDAGSYTCTASNQAGSASCTYALKVLPTLPGSKKDKQERPTSASELDLSITDYEGTEAELDFVSGVSEAEMTDSEMFKPSVHLAVKNNVIVSKQSPASDNESTGTLEANEDEQKSEVAFPTGTQPKFEKFPPNKLKLVEGASIRLDCVISGKPPPLVTWSRNGMMLKSGYRFKVIDDKEQGLYSLLIGMLFPEDVGEYMITATNQFGFISRSVFLVPEDSYIRMQETTNHEAPPDFLPQDGDEVMDSTLIKSPTPDLRFSDGIPDTPIGSIKFKQGVTRSPTPRWSPAKTQDEDVPSDVDKYFMPKFLIMPASRESKEGETIRIDCKVTGRPNPNVEFLHDGTPRIEDARHRIVVKENGIHSLIISPLRPEDSGEYTVVAESAAGKTSCAMQLTVYAQEGIERPRILEKPQSITVKEGDTIRLEVFAAGHPTPEIAWLKDNVLLRPEINPDFRIEGLDGHGLLTIERASKSLHDAWYTATAINKGGRDLTRCKVNVSKTSDEPKPERKLYVPKIQKTPPEMKPYLEKADTHQMENVDEADLYRNATMQKPRFKRKLVSRKQKILGSVHFECYIVPVGDPSMKVEWLLEGKPLECANRIKEAFEFGHAALDITSVFPRDTGVVTCRATNNHGQAQNSCALIVKEERGLIDTTQLNDSIMLERIQSTEKHRQEMSLVHDSHLNYEEEVASSPKVVLHLESVQVQEGEPARFRCRILGLPTPKVSWYLNEQAIRPSKRFRIWHDGIHYLEISATRGYDHGEVRLVAENNLGRVEAKASIEIYQGYDLRSVLHKGDDKIAGKVDSSLKQYRIMRNLEENFREDKRKGKHMVTLREVEKPSIGINTNKKVEREMELQKKFSQLSQEEHVLKNYEANKKKTLKRDRDYELFIRKTKDDLIRREKNPSKELFASKQSYHIRPVKNSLPSIRQHIRNLTAPIGQDAKFSVGFHSESETEVTWYKDEVELNNSNRIDISNSETGISELHFYDVVTDDSGTISVRIKNASGQASSKCFFLVQGSSDELYFSEPLNDISAKENDKSVIFECCVSHPLTNSAQWHFRADAGQAKRILESCEKYQILTEGSRYVLRICDIKLTDAGEYSCVVNTDDDQLKTSARLDVTEISKSIVHGLNDQVTNECGSTRFAVVVSHNDVEGQWLKDGNKLEENEKINTEDRGLKRILMIHECRPSDKGVYEFKFGECSTKATLSVQAMNVSIVKKLTSQQVFGGESVTFEVKLSRSDCVGMWRRKGVEVVPQDNRISINSDLSVHTLTLHACTLEDQGTYSFSVSNSNTEANLIVKDVAILAEMEELAVTETSDAMFQCRVDQSNYKSGKWFRDGVELQQRDPKYEIKVANNLQQLIVKAVTEDDAGHFAYVAGVESFTQADLNVSSIDIIKGHDGVTTYETATVQFDVHLSHGGALGSWFMDGEPLQQNEYRTLSINGKVHSLNISSVICEDSGLYEFRVAKKSCSASLTVKDVHFLEKLADVTVTETKNARFECKVCRDGLTGQWFKDGKRVDDNILPRCQVSCDGCFHCLCIDEVSKDDAGLFVFQVGHMSTSAWLNVNEIKFSKGLRNITVPEGSDAHFKVEVVNGDVDYVCWEKNGNVLCGDETKYCTTAVGRSFTLTIRSVSRQDEAAYSCKSGSAKTTARLYIEEAETSRKAININSLNQETSKVGSGTSNSIQQTTTTSSSTNTFTREINQSFHDDNPHETTLSNPDLEEIVSDMTAEKSIINKVAEKRTNQAVLPYNDTVVKETPPPKEQPLEISASQKKLEVLEKDVALVKFKINKPNVKGVWLKNGALIDLSKETRLKYHVDDLSHQLLVGEVDITDSGQYTFQVDNCRSNTLLHVQALKPPKFLQEIQSCSVVAGQTAKFTITVGGKPHPSIRWYKEKTQILPGSNYQLLQKDDNHSLVIKNTTVVDSGVYKCEIENKLGTVSSTAKLQVKSGKTMPVPAPLQPLPPSILEPLEDFYTKEGKKARFTCKVTGPGIKTAWTRNGEALESSPFVEISNSENEHQLEIPKVDSSDEGVYQIVATNHHGEVSCSARLRFGTIEPPTVVEPLQPAHVIEGSAVKMQCTVDGIQLKTRWYKGDEDITDDERYKWKLDEKSGCCHLIIPDCKVTDNGEIRCRVFNIAGEAVCSTDLRVSGIGKSRRRKNLKEEAELLRIDYSTSKDSSKLQVHSTMTGREFTIHRSDVSQLLGNYISHSDVDPSLTDTPVLAKNYPQYQAELEDDYITPAFTRRPKLESTLTESTARFKCSFVASPRPKVTWFHGNTEIKNNSNRFVTTLERDMLSFQASLEIQDCRLTDAGVYKIVLNNREGSTQAQASLVVTDKNDVVSRSMEDLETLPSVLYCPGLDSLKTYHSETDLRRTGIKIFKDFDNTPSECGSAPASGSITPRRPFSPRRYYERRNKDGRSPLTTDVGSPDTLKSGRESRVSDFEQSYSSISSLSSASIASPSRMSRSFDHDERSLPTDVLSRSLTSTDQRKLNSLKNLSSDSGLFLGMFKSKSNQTLSDFESSGLKTFDERSITTTSVHRNLDYDQDLVGSASKPKSKRGPPHIVSPLPGVVDLHVGGQLILVCNINGHPRPKVVWIKDVENISEDPAFNFERVDLGEHVYKVSMTVPSVSNLHSGTYRLTAYNVHGDVSTDTRVHVQSLEDHHSPSCSNPIT